MADADWKKWAAAPKYVAAASAAKKTVFNDKFWKTAEDLHVVSE